MYSIALRLVILSLGATLIQASHTAYWSNKLVELTESDEVSENLQAAEELINDFKIVFKAKAREQSVGYKILSSFVELWPLFMVQKGEGIFTCNEDEVRRIVESSELIYSNSPRQGKFPMANLRLNIYIKDLSENFLSICSSRFARYFEVWIPEETSNLLDTFLIFIENHDQSHLTEAIQSPDSNANLKDPNHLLSFLYSVRDLTSIKKINRVYLTKDEVASLYHTSIETACGEIEKYHDAMELFRMGLLVSKLLNSSLLHGAPQMNLPEEDETDLQSTLKKVAAYQICKAVQKIDIRSMSGGIIEKSFEVHWCMIERRSMRHCFDKMNISIK